MVKVKFKRLDPFAEIPSYARSGDSGMDVRSLRTCTILPGDSELFSTGLQIELPSGYEAQVRSKSGLALKGLVVANSPGTIDEGYRGIVKVQLANIGRKAVTVVVGDKIAQLVIAPVTRAEIEEVEEISEDTERGAAGYGSTGR